MTTNSVLLHIKEYIESKGYIFQPYYIDSLFLGLKSQSFVILSGNAGVGKTSLARLFAESIGANPNNGRFLRVSVASDWTSPKPLLGFLSPDGNYVPGKITDFLKAASSEPQLPYILCLDNFNISRPEHYMSPLLSALSARQKVLGEVVPSIVCNRSDYGKDNAANLIYGDVSVSDNVFVIATTSCDEVAYPISESVLDHGFVVEIENPDITVKFNRDEKNIETLPLEEIDNSFLVPEYFTSADCDSDFDYLRDISFDFEAFNKIIKHLPSPLGYRSRDALLFYTAYSRRFDVFNNDSLIDSLLMQKLLVRISGVTTNVKNCLINLFQQCLKHESKENEYPNSSYKMYSATMKSGCKYPRTAAKIIYMLRRFEEDGYATYWQR